MQVTPVNGRVERGCGFRQAGGIYLTCGTSDDGLPVEFFLIDPPVRVPTHLDVPKRGVTFLERNGIYHVVDHVGLEHYPNVADFIEETRRHGLSRRAQRNLDFSKITKDSRILLSHARASVENWREYRDAQRAPFRCPKNIGEHESAVTGPCLGVCWEDVEGGIGAEPGRDVKRSMPSFEYAALARPDGVTPIYYESFFLSLPLTGIEVVNDRDGDEHLRAMEAMRDVAGLPVSLVEC